MKYTFLVPFYMALFFGFMALLALPMFVAEWVGVNHKWGLLAYPFIVGAAMDLLRRRPA